MMVPISVTRIYHGGLLKYVTRKEYKDTMFGGDNFIDYMEDWELEAEEHGAVEGNHGHDLCMPNGDEIYNCKEEWEQYKKDGFMKFPYEATDGSICYNREEYECWDRGYYGS